MIAKPHELNKLIISKTNFFLFHGQNEGLKNEILEKNFKLNFKDQVFTYSENEVLSNQENFNNQVLSNSFFEKEKLIIIKRCSDKILKTIEDFLEKNFDDIKVVMISGILDKKSKLRKIFEKQKNTLCIAFYSDTYQTLSSLTLKFFRDKKINISQQNINLIVDRCQGDRMHLNNELEKISNFLKNKDKIELEDLLKLTNLAENFSASELVDNSLAKNRKKTFNILNENNFSIEDCIIILRTYLIKLKRLLNLKNQQKVNQNIDSVISSHKPIIFWKDKEIIKQQMKSLTDVEIKKLIFRTNEIELLVKKNPQISISILTDFVIELAA